MPASETDKILSAKVEAIADDVKVIRELLQGNGDPSKGLVVRVDRIEQREQSRKLWSRGIAAAAIAALCESVANHFWR
jgi:hypothetical protein